MNNRDNVIPGNTRALLVAAVGVLGFSGTLPATRFAAPYLGAVQVGLGRAIIACLCGVVLLTLSRARLPRAWQWPRLCVVSAGVVIGFPWLSAWALHFTTASRASVIVALTPLFTALVGSLRERQRPKLGFWLSSAFGSACVVAYLITSATPDSLETDSQALGMLPELALGLAALFAACGYTEGARLTRELGGLQVISWALLLSMPLVLPLVFMEGVNVENIPWSAWFAFGYVSLISMFAAFYFWYSGLARAGVVRASQVQLLQPLLSVFWAFLFLDEPASWGLLVAAIGVMASVALGVRQARPGEHDPSSPFKLVGPAPINSD